MGDWLKSPGAHAKKLEKKLPTCWGSTTMALEPKQTGHTETDRIDLFTPCVTYFIEPEAQQRKPETASM